MKKYNLPKKRSKNKLLWKIFSSLFKIKTKTKKEKLKEKYHV